MIHFKEMQKALCKLKDERVRLQEPLPVQASASKIFGFDNGPQNRSFPKMSNILKL